MLTRLFAICLLLCNAAALHSSAESSLCGVKWFYCPRDPGCVHYQVSVSSVQITTQTDTSTEVDPSKIPNGTPLAVVLKGTTALDTLDGTTWKTNFINGKANPSGTGDLNSDANIDGGVFEATFNFPFDDNFLDTNGSHFEFGLQTYGADHGSQLFCVEVANIAYTQSLAHDSEKFATECKDEGNGTFVESETMITGTATVGSSSSCTAPTPIPSPTPDSLWSVHWQDANHKSGAQMYVAQDEVDGRTKYYSIDDGLNAKILCTNNTVTLKNRETDNWALSIAIGSAISNRYLQLPATSSPYNVISQTNAIGKNHYVCYQSADPVDAGIEFSRQDTADAFAAIITSTAVMTKVNRSPGNWARNEGMGYFYQDNM